jgi:ubiquinone/menaquinone biosynthesis C-methylase UbiE
MSESSRYPALILDWLTPVYDLFVRLVLRERQFKAALVARAGVASGQRVLDLGAGSGTLAIMIKQSQPRARVRGLDGDPTILASARNKAARAGVDVAFDLGNATALPYRDGTFDRVLSSLVFSLLSTEGKRLAAGEAYRVLLGGGEVHIADFGPPHTAWGRLLARRMRRFQPITDNLDGRLPSMFREAGFEAVEEVARQSSLLGTISILSGRKPSCA